MNDLVVKQRVVIPIVYRPAVAALSEKLRAMPVAGTTLFGLCRTGL
jgi:hypothetical protein